MGKIIDIKAARSTLQGKNQGRGEKSPLADLEDQKESSGDGDLMSKVRELRQIRLAVVDKQLASIEETALKLSRILGEAVDPLELTEELMEKRKVLVSRLKEDCPTYYGDELRVLGLT